MVLQRHIFCCYAFAHFHLRLKHIFFLHIPYLLRLWPLSQIFGTHCGPPSQTGAQLVCCYPLENIRTGHSTAIC